MSRYRHAAIGELCSELLYSPAEVRRLHVLRLESLLQEFDAAQQYPLEYIRFRLTGFTSPDDAPLAFTGVELRADLCLLLQHLSAAISDPAGEQAEPVLRLAKVASRCSVSLRTVHRWRREGLVARMFVFADGRHHVAVREGVLQRFLEAHPQRLHRRRPISKITARERDEILRRARELVAENGRTFSHIVRQIAAERGRAPETVRYTLRGLEGAGADRIFPARAPALNQRGRRRILREYRSGTPVVELAKRYGRSRSAIYTVLRREGRREALETKTSYVSSPEFDVAGAERAILGREGLDLGGTLPDAGIRPVQRPDSLPDLGVLPVLTREQEADIFRRYNYVKYRIAKAQARIAGGRCTRKQLELIARLRGAAEALRRSLIRCNLRLVVAIARRHMGRLTNLSELTSIGNIALMRAVEGFDYTRGNKFSTYAGWAITRQYARTIPQDNFRLATFVTGHEEILLAAHDMPDESVERADWLAHLRALIERGLAGLDDREGRIIRSRFGIGGIQPMTLEQVGAMFGLTRERIRQIEAAGLRKLHALLGDDTGRMLALQS